MGTSASDIVQIRVAGTTCQLSNYTSPTQIWCITGTHPRPEDPHVAEVYVSTLSGGSGAGSPGSATYRYNAAPVITSIIPQNGPVTGFTRVTIGGANLGVGSDDLLDITVAGVSCSYSQRWITPNSTSCVTAQAITATTGTVVLRTRSGGASITTVPFTYKPACYLHSSKDLCGAERCFWCTTSSACLGDAASCPPDCNSFSCASLLIVMLIVGFIILLIPITFLVIRFVNREAKLKK